MVTAFVDSPVSFDAVLAAAVGWLVGAAVLVAAGAPSRRPTRAGRHRRALPRRAPRAPSSSGRASTPAGRRPTSASKRTARSCSSRRSATDERSADLLFRLYRRLLPRDFGDEKRSRRCGAPSSTRRSSPSRRGTSASGRRACGPSRRPSPNGYVLAYEAIDGRSLDRLDPSEVTDDVLAAIWRLVGELRRHRIAHRDLRLANIFLDDRGRGVAHRLRLQRGGRLGSAAGHRRRRAARLVQPVRRPRARRRPRRRQPSTRRRCRGRSTGCARGRSAARRARRSRPGRVCSTSCASRLAAAGRRCGRR